MNARRLRRRLHLLRLQVDGFRRLSSIRAVKLHGERRFGRLLGRNADGFGPIGLHFLRSNLHRRLALRGGILCAVLLHLSHALGADHFIGRNNHAADFTLAREGEAPSVVDALIDEELFRARRLNVLHGAVDAAQLLVCRVLHLRGGRGRFNSALRAPAVVEGRVGKHRLSLLRARLEFFFREFRGVRGPRSNEAAGNERKGRKRGGSKSAEHDEFLGNKKAAGQRV